MLVHGPVKMALFKVLSTTDLFQASRMLASMVVSASKATHTAIIRSITKVRNAILVLIAWFVYVHIKRGMQFGLRQKCSHARENWWNDQRNIYWNSWLKYFIGVHCRILFWTWIENVMHVSYWVNYHIKNALLCHRLLRKPNVSMQLPPLSQDYYFLLTAAVAWTIMT